VARSTFKAGLLAIKKLQPRLEKKARLIPYIPTRRTDAMSAIAPLLPVGHKLLSNHGRQVRFPTYLTAFCLGDPL
jgi:hypothetical protein